MHKICNEKKNNREKETEQKQTEGLHNKSKKRNNTDIEESSAEDRRP